MQFKSKGPYNSCLKHLGKPEKYSSCGNIFLLLGRERLVKYSPGHISYMQLHRLSSESVYTELGVHVMDLGCSFYLYSPHRGFRALQY